ncbi:MAG: GNAT family N-acetyltransferase [Devosia sp.]|nr:GNAT family N-acetyltransferase [Devosia sp.]
MTLLFRDATEADLGFIVRLIAEDAVVPAGDLADQPDHPRYRAALAEISADPNQRLIVATEAGRPVGTLQLTFIPGIAGLGMRRCLVEAVHVDPACRNRGHGSRLMRFAIAEAQHRGCGMVQLTSNKKRLDAHRFYTRLGFVGSHEGFKLRF